MFRFLESILRWIARQSALDGENAGWVIGTQFLITKALLSFLAKVCWAIDPAQLQPTGNYNTLSPSLLSLVGASWLVI